MALELAVGRLPRGIQALHKCNTPGCIEPRHLYAGTPQQNMDDKLRAGHQPRGEKSGNAKLTATDVVEIRRLTDSGLTFREIGELYNIDASYGWKIQKRIVWGHIDG